MRGQYSRIASTPITRLPSSSSRNVSSLSKDSRAAGPKVAKLLSGIPANENIGIIKNIDERLDRLLGLGSDHAEHPRRQSTDLHLAITQASDEDWNCGCVLLDHPKRLGGIEPCEGVRLGLDKPFDVGNGGSQVEWVAIGRMQTTKSADRRSPDLRLFVAEGFEESRDRRLPKSLNLAKWISFKVRVLQAVGKLPQQIDHLFVHTVSSQSLAERMGFATDRTR